MKKETTELQIIDSAEFGIEPKKAKEITSGLTTILSEREELEKSYKQVLALEVTPENIPKFKELRLKIRDNRTKGIDQWHKVNKDFYLKGGQFVDAIKRKESLVNEQMEEKLLEAEKFFENQEKERLVKLNEDRKTAIKPYIEDLGNLDFSNMPEDVWIPYFESKKKAFEDKIEADRIEAERVENERIEKEKENDLHFKRWKEISALSAYSANIIDVNGDFRYSKFSEEEFQEILNQLNKAKEESEKEIEAQRLENERLKQEAEAKESQMQKERAEAEEKQKAIQEEADKKAREEKEKQDAILKTEQEAKAKLESELKAKQEAEEKTKAERLEKERQAKLEAEKLAKAPIKKQLTVWVDSFSISDNPITGNETSTLITEKFEAFKKWAKSEIEKL